MTLTLPAAHPGRYFAALTPDCQRMTFWHLDKRGRLVSWPRGTTNAPVLWKKPGPGREHVVPAGLTGQARSEWVGNWVATVSGPWMDAIRSAITADPDLAAARFAALSVVCCRCGRPLEDPESRAAGLGPKCAPFVAAPIREAISREIGRVLAAKDRDDVDAAVLSADRVLDDAVSRLRDEVPAS